jgi:hypothetical protein
MSVAWTEAARKQLVSRSGEGAIAPKRPAVGAAWGTVRRALRYANAIPDAFELGRERTTPEYAELMTRAAAHAGGTTMPRFDDPRVAAVFALLVTTLQKDNALLTSIYPRQGLAFALEVSLALTTMDVTTNLGTSWVHDRTVRAEPDRFFRDVLLAEPDEIRAQCKEVGRRAWPTASLVQKTTLAYTFFDERAWTSEVCRAWAASSDPLPADFVYPIVSDLEVAQELVKRRTQARSLLELVETFGDDALQLIVEAASNPRDGEPRWIAEALAQFDDSSAAEAIAPLVKHAPARPFVQDFFARHPQHEAALSGAGGGGKAAMIAKEVRAGAKRATEKHDGELAVEELPPIFRAPPWETTKRPKKPRATLDLSPLDVPMTVAWQAGEREAALLVARRYTYTAEDAKPDAVAAHRQSIARRKQTGFFVHSFNQRLPDDCVLETWNSGVPTWGPSASERLSYALAKFGDAALPGAVKLVDLLERERGDVSFLLRVGSPRLAYGMAKLARSPAWAPLAWRWMKRWSELAVIGLVPFAFADKTHEIAESVLSKLATMGTDVLAIGARYGEDAKAAIEALLEWDALLDAPKRPPKLPTSSWKPETLTRPVRTDGKLFPIEAVSTIGTMLAFSPIEPPYAGLALVKSLCTPRSLAELSWDLARSWERAGRKKRERWMLMSLVHFADDEVVRRMTPGIRDDDAVDVLERIDSDAALTELATIAGRTTDAKLGARIELILDRAASLRGLDKDELEEELAPVKPLEADGTVSLDFGARKLRVGFDEHLQPFVLNESGERVRALAPPRPGDDPVRAEKAKALWRDLKEDVAVLAARRISGLRRAMINGRRWTASRFQRVWIDNALMKHVARGVVWTDGTSPFRVAEDGSLSNVHDETFTLRDDAIVRVLHPLRARREDLDRMRALFADYRIVQPFMQLDRVPIERMGERAPAPLSGAKIDDLTARLLERGFTRFTFTRGRYGFRRELAVRGAIGIEFDGADGRVTKPEIVFVGEELDLIEISDIVDDVQAAAPSSAMS